jgi:hypothetical protein
VGEAITFIIRPSLSRQRADLLMVVADVFRR